jgi:1-acyl-sn-glycerol-3-phosphate acyltransferase
VRWLARVLLGARGWRFEGALPPAPKFVAIGVPHTTNWDFVVFLAVLSHFGVRARWIGKHTLFRPPFGGLMRRLGGIAVDRTKATRVVDQVAAEFSRAERLILVIAPEGTRSRAAHWKSGFYEIARRAGVPIALAYLDYPGKRAGIGPLLVPSGDVAADMDRIRAFYADKVGKHPEQQGPIRLRDESP